MQRREYRAVNAAPCSFSHFSLLRNWSETILYPARMIATANTTPHPMLELDLRSILEAALLRLSRRFRFETHPMDHAVTLIADDLTLHVLEDDRDFTVIFEPFDSPNDPLHISARSNEIEAVLRELLAS